MTGRLTLPTDADIIDETIRLKNLLGADALRDCDGTEMPEALLSEPVKKYATYYTTRKDNEWVMKHPEEIQQEYLISNRITARGETLRIRLMEGFHTEQLKVNTLDDPKRWQNPPLPDRLSHYDAPVPDHSTLSSDRYRAATAHP